MRKRLYSLAEVNKKLKKGTSKMIIAIDPGPTLSAWVLYEPLHRKLRSFKIEPTQNVLTREWFNENGIDPLSISHIAVEMVACYGMPVGREVFETALWVGRLIERSIAPSTLVYRREVKMTITGDSRAKDKNIRQGLMNRWGGSIAQGTKKFPGPLYGVSKDVWAALGVAVTFAIKNKLEEYIV